ncbi:MAG TPA: carbonic anhydrase, partial [Candidatus Dormibacteraeota bacterium]|nr:carbonic anhydrase [Candidatus Dormibacteraeota bacterium]
DAHLIRNAGGIVTADVIRSLMISQRLLGTTEIILIQHDKCGLQDLAEEEFRAAVRADTGTEPDLPIGAFTDPAQSVRAGVKRIMESPLLPSGRNTRGFVFEHKTGRLREVTPAPGA